MSQETGRAGTPEKLLDAALRCVLNYGLTRTTLTDVAKEADLSRMTVYRHYSSVGEILQDLMTREFNAVVVGVDAFAGEDAPLTITREQLVGAAVGSLDALTQNPLFQRILTTDPELLLTYVTERPGRFQLYAEGLLAAGISLAQQDGEVREGEAGRLASSMLLAMRGYALTDKSQWSKKHRTALLDDMARMLDGLLRPEGDA